MLEEDVYPSEETLQTISDWSILDFEGLAKYLCENWYWPDYANWNGIELVLITGGWSGNEDLINAMSREMKNLYLYEYRRGGRYVFKR